MQSSNIPAKFPIPFANNAGGSYIAAIPEASQIGSNPGRASLYDGFVPLNFTAVNAGGIPPYGKDVNGILYQITANDQWFEAGAPITWDSTFSAAIGGYPKGSVLQSAAFGGWWLSTAENNTTNPDAAGAGWVSFTPLNLYAADTGSANAAAITLPYAATTYAQLLGHPITIQKIASINTGAMTLNVNGIGAVAVTSNTGAALVNGNLPASGVFTVVHDGTKFQCLTPLVSTAVVQVFTRNEKSGFRLEVSTQTAVRIYPGACADSTNTVGIFSAINLGVDLATSGNGGLDSASTLQTGHWYAIYMISGVAGTGAIAHDITGLTTLPSPVLPVGYQYFRYIGSILTYYNSNPTVGITVVPFTQLGDTFWWNEPMQDIFIWQFTQGGNNTVWSYNIGTYTVSAPPCVQPRLITRALLTYPYAGPFGVGPGGEYAGPIQGGVVGIYSPDFEQTGVFPGDMYPNNAIGDPIGGFTYFGRGWDLSNTSIWLGEGNPSGVVPYGVSAVAPLSFGYSSGPSGTQELVASTSGKIGISAAAYATSPFGNGRLPVGLALWTRGYVDSAFRDR